MRNSERLGPDNTNGTGYVELIGERLGLVRRRIERAGGDPDAVRIVAVTKTFKQEAVLAAMANGIIDIGENYAGELTEKADAVFGATGVLPRWHFLGQIQRNKLRYLAGRIALYQSVDRLEEGQAIARHDPGAHVLIEVDTTGDPQRGGVSVDFVAPLLAALGDFGLVVEGLMTVAPAGGGEAASLAFEKVATLADELALPVRSMGMSEDLELAVAHGTTMVRIGRALFGSRPNLRSVAE